MGNVSKTSRRGALKLSAAAIAASLASPAIANAASTIGEDPVLAVYRKYVFMDPRGPRLIAKHRALEAQFDASRKSYQERYRDVLEEEDTDEPWRHDPDFLRMRVADAGLSQMNADSADVLSELVETKATTKEGLRIKIRMLTKHIGDVDDMDYDGQVLFHLLNDALSLLGEQTL